jgi:hypothetical protein
VNKLNLTSRPEGKTMATGTRARRGNKAAAQPAEEVEETNGSTVRAPSEMHELMADFFNENYDAGVTPRQCAIFTSKRTAFRKSDGYQEYRAAGGDDEGETKPARASKAKAASEGEEPKPAARRGRRAAAAKPEAEEAEDTTEAKATPARRARRAGKAEPPVADEAASPARTTPRRARRTAAAKPAESEEEPF